MKLIIVIILLGFIAYVGSCSFINNKRESAFNLISIGDTEDTVIDFMGAPSYRETDEKLFSRYANRKCNKCSERLWFENRLSFDTKAWSVEVNKIRKVVKKDSWVSP